MVKSKKEKLIQALLYEKKRKNVFCRACLKYCKINDGEVGYCKTRINKKNVIYTNLNNYVAGLNVKDIEAVPLFHIFPTSKALSLTNVTNDLKNFLIKEWSLNQHYLPSSTKISEMDYKKVTRIAVSEKVKVIVFDYIESALCMDFAYKVMRNASRYNIKTFLGTNGFLSYELIRNYSRFIDGFLFTIRASLDKDFYKNYEVIKNIDDIKDNIRAIKKRFIHFEVENLIIPKIGDKEESLRELAEFLVDLDPNIPLHLVQFFPDERFSDIEATPQSKLERLAEIAMRAGLRYVYISNVANNPYLHTYCYNCQNVVIERSLFRTEKYLLINQRCPNCGFRINVVEK